MSFFTMLSAQDSDEEHNEQKIVTIWPAQLSAEQLLDK